MMNEQENYLKQGVVLLIEEQEHLNMLAKLEGIKQGELHIDQPYVAYMDEVLHVIPLSEVDDSFPVEFRRPRKFKSWYRTQMRKKEWENG